MFSVYIKMLRELSTSRRSKDISSHAVEADDTSVGIYWVQKYRELKVYGKQTY
jgi:hypothetical protein